MIKVKKSPTADTRTCDVTKVTKEQLRESSISHIRDVELRLEVLSNILRVTLIGEPQLFLVYLL